MWVGGLSQTARRRDAVEKKLKTAKWMEQNTETEAATGTDGITADTHSLWRSEEPALPQSKS